MTDMQVHEPGAGTSGHTSEIKFVVDAGVAVQIREWARMHLAADPHGSGPFSDEYPVSSVYFDTGARDVFHRRGSYGRSKFRIRRYDQEGIAFVERKLRTGSRLAKRRTTIDLSILPLLARPGALNGDATFWFRRRVALRGLEPVCQVNYVRMARVSGTSGAPARLTLDEHVTALISGSFNFETRPGISLLEGQTILELKYGRLIPSVFKQLVEEFKLTPRRSSKYRAAARSLGLVAAPVAEEPDQVDA